MNGAGENFDLTNDANILAINSPQKSVGGPYKVVFKDIEERWVIVAMDWTTDFGTSPVLGIRWFWNEGGNPVSTGHAVWFVIPDGLSAGVLDKLPLVPKFRRKIDDFLAGVITGEQL